MLCGVPIRYDDLEEAGQTDIDFKMLASDALGAISAADSGGKNRQEATIERVNGMKEQYGNGVSTLVMFYNATGSTMKFEELEDVCGHLFEYHPDETVYNGQWSCFLHVKPAAAAKGSFGKLRYKLEGGVEKDSNYFYINWETPWSGTNTASAGFIDTSYLNQGGTPLEMLKRMQAALADCPFTAKVRVSQTSSPLLSVIASRKGLL